MNHKELLDRYKNLLQSFDPWYSYSPDHNVYKQGERIWLEIYSLQPKVDLDWKIYNRLKRA